MTENEIGKIVVDEAVETRRKWDRRKDRFDVVKVILPRYGICVA